MKNNLWCGRVWVTPQALRVGNHLIGKLKIKPGYGIAPYLDLDPFYTNCEAIYLWVEKMLAMNTGREISASHLVGRFLELMPEALSGEVD